jgi:hypothetical protein
MSLPRACLRPLCLANRPNPDWQGRAALIPRRGAESVPLPHARVSTSFVRGQMTMGRSRSRALRYRLRAGSTALARAVGCSDRTWLDRNRLGAGDSATSLLRAGRSLRAVPARSSCRLRRRRHRRRSGPLTDGHGLCVSGGRLTKGRPSRAAASLSDLDRHILGLLSSLRVLTLLQLASLSPETPPRTLRYRTARLAKHGFLGRTRPYRERGSAPHHLWPTRKGEATANGEPPPRGGERREPNPLFLAHAAGLSELYVVLTTALPRGHRAGGLRA